MASEGILVFAGIVVGLIAAVLWLSVPFMLYSVRSSLQEIQETLDDLREIELEIARRLGPVRTSAPPASTAASIPGPDAEADASTQPSLRSQAEQIRQGYRD